MLSKLITGAFILGLAVCVSAQDKITMSNSGAVQSGAIIKVDPNTVTLRTASGELGISRKDIARIEIQKPAEVDAALKAADTKKYAEAVPILQGVTDKYQDLREPWLEQAYAVLGESLAATGQPLPAASAYNKLLKYYPQSRYVLRAKVGLAQGLMAEKKYEDAVKLLETATEPLRKELAISESDNASLGSAMVVLGDCYRQMGQLEKALDCYLSTVVLYSRDKDSVEQARKKADELKEKLKSS